MDYGLILQHNRNDMIKNLAEQNVCKVVETAPVHYMDLRPYMYSSTVSEFEVTYVDELLKAIHYKKLPPTIFLGESQKNNSRIKSLLERVTSYDKLPIMIATQETLVTQEVVDPSFKAYSITTTNDLVLWCKVIVEGLFNNADMPLEPMLRLYTFALEDERYLLTLGTVNGTPVSAGIGYISRVDDQQFVGGIYMIATVKTHRGHGYGSRLTYELSKSLLDLGATFTMLDASEMGASLYLKMGYKPVGYSYRFYPNEAVSE